MAFARGRRAWQPVGRMIYILLNAGPILLATLVGLGVGWALWRPRGRRYWLTAMPAEAWLCAILAGALILAPPRADQWTMALASAFVIWIGFIVPALLVTHRLRSLPTRAALVDCGHWLGTMLVQAAVLKAWGLVPPPVA